MRGPRCRCGAKITHTPGKVPRVYCSDRCRQAARRALAHVSVADGGNRGRLGKGLTEFSKRPDQREQPQAATPDTARGEREGGSPLSQRERAAAAAAVRRYQVRKTLNRVSKINACRGCGRRALDPDTGVIYARSSRGYAVTLGLVRCGRIWFCAECSAAIRRGRTEETKTAALRHLAAGGTLAVVVLTGRHNATTELAALSDAMWGAPKLDAAGDPVLDKSGRPRREPGAYQRMLTAPAFYGRPERATTWTRKDGTVGSKVYPAEEGIRHRIGYAGMIRASEVTRSQRNGYHPHMNVLAFLGARMDGTPAKGRVAGYFAPGEAELEEWGDWLREVWADGLRKADPKFRPSTECFEPGCKCEGNGHGVMIKIVTSADDTALIEYLTKVQDGKPRADSVTDDLGAAGGAALETVRADTKTAGRGRVSMTPFQMLGRLWDLERVGLDPDQAEGYGTAAQCRVWWAEYETAMAGRRAIEWTRGLRDHVGIEGDDSEEKDLEYVYEGAAKDPLSGGVVMTPDAHDVLVQADAELDMQDVVVREFYDSAPDVVATFGGRPEHVRVATAEELEEVQANLSARLATKQRKAKNELLLLRLRGELDAALKALPADAPANAAAELQQRFFRALNRAGGGVN